MDLLAVDAALLLSQKVDARARAINAGLVAAQPDGFRFDATHLPHITLAQLFVQRTNLPRLLEDLGGIFDRAAPLPLRVLGIDTHESTVLFLVERTAALQGLHEEIMNAVAPLEEREGTGAAFFTEIVEGTTSSDYPRDRDIEWVREFRSQAAYGNFVPHVTLGLGPPPQPIELFVFTADCAGLFHLGRFCTCRVALREWRLENRSEPRP